MFGKHTKGTLRKQLADNRDKSLEATRKAIRDRLLLAAAEGKDSTYFCTKEFPRELIEEIANEESLGFTYITYSAELPLVISVGWDCEK